MSDADPGTDPWSRDVPVTPPPTSFDFDSAPARSATQPAPAVEPPTTTRSREEVDQPQLGEQHRRRRAPSFIAAAAVVALVVGGVAIANRDESGTPTEAEQTAATASVDASTTTSPALERTTTARAPTTRASTAPRTTPLPTVPAPPPAWVDGQVVVPERIGQIDGATELVALTNGGKVLRIDLPHGQTSTLDLDRRRPASTLHLGATNILVANEQGGESTLIPAVGDPVTVNIDGSSGINILGTGPGLDDFFGYVWSFSNGEERLVAIRADGSVDDVDMDVNPWNQGDLAPTGERWIADAGGLYLETPDGAARRVSTGQPIAISGATALVRECTEQRVCGWFVIEIDSDERVAAVAPDGFSIWDQPIQSTALSPDGRTLLVVFWDDQDATLIDLATGAQTPANITATNRSGSSPAHWAPDSSGYFTITAGTMLFVDRATGDTTEFGIEFETTDVFIDLGLRPITD